MTEKTDWINLAERPLLKQIARAFITIITITIVIGIGWYLQSSAMQWAGFGLLAFVTLANGINPPKYKTPQQATDYLFEKYQVQPSKAEPL